MLGPIRVENNGRPVALTSPRRQRILAALAAYHGRMVTFERLIDIVWGEPPPRAARESLHSHVSRLRDTLSPDGARVVTRSGGYALELDDDDEFDVARFELSARRARELLADDPPAAVAAADLALSLWRGPAYGGVNDADPFRAEAVRLDELRVSTAEIRVSALLSLQRPAEVLGELRSTVAAHPLREQPVGQLMRALGAAGRRAEALAAFREHRDRMADELGLEPAGWLVDLYTELLRTAPTPAAAPAPATAPDGTGTMPEAPLTTLYGREDDIAAVRSVLDRARLVTLTGPGGVGKTRLAWEVVRRSGERYDAVVWAALAPVGDPDALGYVLADAAGLTPSGATPVFDALVSLLQARPTLLILDNAEHLLPALGTYCRRLLQRCPPLQVLATSRQRLAVDGEHLWRVDPLPVPDSTVDVWHTPAGQLLRDRATASDPSLRPDDETSAAAVELCRGLDGIPLAIELAAGRAAAVSLPVLARRLADRFEVLTTGTGTDSPESRRHRTLAAMVDWSYELLAEPERTLFDRLSGFAGGFSLEAAEQVCSADGIPVTGALLRLVDRSMVQRRGERYDLLETLRLYGRQRLDQRGEAPTVLAAHAGYYHALADRAGQGVCGAEEARWVRVVQADLPNLRAAHQWAVSAGDLDTALGIPATLWRYAQWRAAQEVFVWAQRAVAVPGAEDHPSFAGALAAVAMGASNRGDLGAAVDLAQQALTAAAAPAQRLVPRHVLALAALYQGRLRDCLDHEAEVERLAGDLGARHEVVDARSTRAVALAYLGDVDAALALARRSTREARALGNPTSIALALHCLGEAEQYVDPAAALASYAEALAVARAVGAGFAEYLTLVSISSVSGRVGDPARAVGSFREVIDHWRQAGNWTHQWVALRNLIELLARLRRDEPAVVLLGASASSTTAPPAYGDHAQRLRQVAADLRHRLGADAFDAAHARGTALDDAAAVAHALDQLDRLAVDS